MRVLPLVSTMLLGLSLGVGPASVSASDTSTTALERQLLKAGPLTRTTWLRSEAIVHGGKLFVGIDAISVAAAGAPKADGLLISIQEPGTQNTHSSYVDRDEIGPLLEALRTIQHAADTWKKGAGTKTTELRCRTRDWFVVSLTQYDSHQILTVRSGDQANAEVTLEAEDAARLLGSVESCAGSLRSPQ